jgi:hypothetical protein
MARRKKYTGVDPFIREEQMVVNNITISKGDLIKIKGIYSTEFKFLCLVTNPANGVQWIDCIQIHKGLGCGFRSFYPERVKPIVKRKKRVKRTRISEAS